MRDALALSIAETAANVLGQRSDARGGISVTDEAIGAHLWFERGFRDHDALVAIINHTRRLLYGRAPRLVAALTYGKPVQLSLDLEAA